jgi:apolipoprotein D and lipocalin family protein
MKKTTLPLLLFALFAGACGTTTTERLGLEDPKTIQDFDLERYDGKWFEIGSYPQYFQEGCSATTAEYEIRENGEVGVTNRCIKSGEEDVARGMARPVELDAGKLEVSFFGPFYGDYWILEIGEEDGPDADYTWAAVGSPSRDYLWILSRNKDMDDETLAMIWEKLEAQSFFQDRFVYTEH